MKPLLIWSYLQVHKGHIPRYRCQLSVFCILLLELANDRTIREEHGHNAGAHNREPDRILLGYFIILLFYVLALGLHHLARFRYLLLAYLCVAVSFLNDATSNPACSRCLMASGNLLDLPEWGLCIKMTRCGICSSLFYKCSIL
jgi:hypothetical protein